MQQSVRQYKETWNHYDKVRHIALVEAHDDLRNVLVAKNIAVLKSEITLAGLDQVTFRKLASWHYYGERLAKWDWQAVEKTYRTHPKRFELAIWHREHFLAGASIGRPTWNGKKLRLDLIEANPTGSAISGIITEIVLTAANSYALAIGANQVRIIDPVNEKVRSHYLRFAGFLYDEQENICYRNL